jgi:hypothetical protein
MNPNEKYKDEIQKEIDTINDDLYKQTREKVTQGQRVPYREYIKRRSLIWLEEIADHDEVQQAQQVLLKRLETTLTE